MIDVNVIVSNKQKEIIDNANIDAIKDLNGLFNVDDLINKFKNYFFTKMILDATSVIDFASVDVLKKLVDGIGADRLIILLPSTPEPPDEFKKLLISLKIYNFSNSIDDVVKFIDNPNTYENVVNSVADSYNDSNGFYVDNSIKDGDSVSDDKTVNNEDSFHSSLGDIMNKISVNDSMNSNFENNNSNFNENQDIYNIDLEEQDDTYDDNEDQFDMTDYSSMMMNQDENNDFNKSNLSENSVDINSTINSDISYDNDAKHNVFLNMDYEDNIDKVEKGKKIIGFKNVTLHAGSTTLIYMLHNIAKKRNMDVLSLEINKNDFKLFHDNKMITVNGNNIREVLDSAREEVIFVDLNDCEDDSFCKDIIYLIEPSIIKLNWLMMTNREIFNELKDKKVVLNKSMLSESDIPILENEAAMKFYFNIGAINDRKNNQIIEEFFDNLINNN